MMLLRNSNVLFHVLFISTIYLAFKAQPYATNLNPRRRQLLSNPQQGPIQSSQHNGEQQPNQTNGLSGSNQSQIDDQMAQEFLQAHNEVRAKYGVPPLIWDKSLADFAQQHASKLISDCSMVHSVGKYGENLFWGKLSHWTPKRIVEDWAKESEYFNLKKAECLKDWTECGHFTQIIWADTIRVGCYRIQCIGTNKGYIGVCSYDPPGNVAKQNPFIKTNAPTMNNTSISQSPQNVTSTNSSMTPRPPNTPTNTSVMPMPQNKSSTNESVMLSPANVSSTNEGAQHMPQNSLSSNENAK